jgi:uncharacterized protein with HEPN domain
MTRRNRIIIEKIIKEVEEANLIIHDIDMQTFLESEIHKRAVCMTLLNVGELVKNLTSDFRLSNDHVPWKDFSGFRDVAAHGYFTIRMEAVWGYVVNDALGLAELLKNILKSDENLP